MLKSRAATEQEKELVNLIDKRLTITFADTLIEILDKNNSDCLSRNNVSTAVIYFACNAISSLPVENQEIDQVIERTVEGFRQVLTERLKG